MEQPDLIACPILPNSQIQCHDLTSFPSTHIYSTRNKTAVMDALNNQQLISMPLQPAKKEQVSSAVSENNNQAPKSVAFELLFTESPQHRARIPMRVQIFPHDTTDSIVTTVKNFYGLYPSPNYTKGVSFEDEEGNTLIARYENFRNNMVVYVRVIDEPIPNPGLYRTTAYPSGSSRLQESHHSDDAHHSFIPLSGQVLSYDQSSSRATSRTSLKRGSSPNQGRGSRASSASINSVPVKKTRSRSGPKFRGSGLHAGLSDNLNDVPSGYSSGDGTSGLVITKTRSEHIGSTEISLDNIVEGGRRKRAKFESSELPLFAPPQMPAVTSNSSVSPARCAERQRSLGYPQPNTQNSFRTPQLLQSPQGLQIGIGRSINYSTPSTENHQSRCNHSNRQSIYSTPNCNSSNIIPTPDPTVGSCMSEEDKDVALQLMRLGEMSNISHGRTSASTLDDTFSGKADATSSTGATSECESESGYRIPPIHRVKCEASPIPPTSVMNNLYSQPGDNLPSQDSTEVSCDEGEYEDGRDETFKPRIKEILETVQFKSAATKARNELNISDKPLNSSSASKARASSKIKGQRSAQNKSKKSAHTKPVSPASLPPPSRKASISSSLNLQSSVDVVAEDLSSKPRCQRCRKSKKGCDRQRPCQRCKDAGLSAHQCVSEDEGNGRKGRYGRHMGVPVKKDGSNVEIVSQPSIVAAGGLGSPSKKRKR